MDHAPGLQLDGHPPVQCQTRNPDHMPFVFHHRDTVALGTRHVLVNHDVLKLARSARSQELNAITR
jgi:hypothetical protein